MEGNLLVFSLATGERWTDKETGEEKETTTWVPCKLRWQQATYQPLLKKGLQVHLAGSLVFWKTKEDNQHGAYVAIVPWIKDHFICVDSRQPARKHVSETIETQSPTVTEDDIPF